MALFYLYFSQLDYRKIMSIIKKKYNIEGYQFSDDGMFPNNRHLPVLFYKGVLDLPVIFSSSSVRNLFEKNGWNDVWENNVYEYHHYHSRSHEVLGVYQGKTTLLIGGNKGVEISVKKGDVLIIPAGVAHKNLGPENSIKVVEAYSKKGGYDINHGYKDERLKTERNIQSVPIPMTDPVFGAAGEMMKFWNF